MLIKKREHFAPQINILFTSCGLRRETCNSAETFIYLLFTVFPMRKEKHVSGLGSQLKMSAGNPQQWRKLSNATKHYFTQLSKNLNFINDLDEMEKERKKQLWSGTICIQSLIGTHKTFALGHGYFRRSDHIIVINSLAWNWITIQEEAEQEIQRDCAKFQSPIPFFQNTFPIKSITSIMKIQNFDRHTKNQVVTFMTFLTRFSITQNNVPSESEEGSGSD